MNDKISVMLMKLVQLEREFALQYGPFALFCLLQPEEAGNLWDLVVSASWIEQLQTVPSSKSSYQSVRALRPNYEAFFARLQVLLTADELIMLSRVVTLKPHEAFVEVMNSRFQVEHGAVELRNQDVEGVEIKRGFIITSQSRTNLRANMLARA